MTADWLHPGLLLILGAWLVPLFKGRAKQAVMVVLPAAALIDCLVIGPGTYGVVRFLGHDLRPARET
jgi:multicomponent Na+:H+ antiporter subunit D